MKILISFFLFFLFSHLRANPVNLARHFAPVVYQEEGSVPEADEFTRIDFDGDWNPDNNWENMPKFKRERIVYWDVIESEQHYFITYAFFYPRDYASWCFWIHCHENDFEGMRVTVKKPDRVIKVEALAHNFKSEVHNPVSIEVMIERGGHGVHPLVLRKPEGKVKKYTPKDYQLLQLEELWKKRNSSLFTGKFTYKNKTYPASFGGKKWILFGIGAAKPAWSWIIWGSDIEKGQWFLDPLKGSGEKYLRHLTAGSEDVAVSD